ncbi:MAG TPA: ATP-binding protein, partial [Candidatus Nanopelagicales bacterium]|nr:ATP-binding protein [Candidatus Nanopelagicales bacterium]
MNDHEASRLHSAVLVSPKRERRRDRKTRKLAARDLLARDRAEQKTVARAKADALTAERKATVLLPKAGEPGT